MTVYFFPIHIYIGCVGCRHPAKCFRNRHCQCAPVAMLRHHIAMIEMPKVDSVYPYLSANVITARHPLQSGSLAPYRDLILQISTFDGTFKQHLAAIWCNAIFGWATRFVFLFDVLIWCWLSHGLNEARTWRRSIFINCTRCFSCCVSDHLFFEEEIRA